MSTTAQWEDVSDCPRCQASYQAMSLAKQKLERLKEIANTHCDTAMEAAIIIETIRAEFR